MAYVHVHVHVYTFSTHVKCLWTDSRCTLGLAGRPRPRPRETARASMVHVKDERLSRRTRVEAKPPHPRTPSPAEPFAGCLPSRWPETSDRRVRPYLTAWGASVGWTGVPPARPRAGSLMGVACAAKASGRYRPSTWGCRRRRPRRRRLCSVLTSAVLTRSAMEAPLGTTRTAKTGPKATTRSPETPARMALTARTAGRGTTCPRRRHRRSRPRHRRRGRPRPHPCRHRPRHCRQARRPPPRRRRTCARTRARTASAAEARSSPTISTARTGPLVPKAQCACWARTATIAACGILHPHRRRRRAEALIEVCVTGQNLWRLLI